MTSSPYLHKRTSAAFRHRMVVALANRRRSLNPVAQGFTLVELMIVVAIVGILSAVALPNYLQARSAALIGARVGEAVGFAKECAVFTVTGIGETPAPPTPVSDVNGKVVVDKCTGQDAGGTVTATWGKASADGVSCLSEKSVKASQKAVITVTDKGELSCEFS